MESDGVDERGELLGRIEGAGAQGGEDGGEGGVEGRRREAVGVAQVLDVFGQVAEEEDVGVADLARDLDLWWKEASVV